MATLKNPRYEKFAQCLANGLSQRKAYRAAYPKSKKWKDATVDSKASSLAKNDKVLERLLELANESSSKAVMSARERKEWLTRVIKEDTNEMRDRLRAVDILNRMEGEYIEKVEVKDDERQQQKESISNIESLVKQMVQVEEDDISE